MTENENALNSETPQLSLCIPTYNRAALLDQALKAALEQIGPEEAAQVEVLIFDNASPDRTPEVIETAKRQRPHIPICHVRHPENIGAEANFLGAIQRARGKFVLLLSDDDILLPGAVSQLLALIRTHPGFDGFGLNAYSFLDNPSERGAPWLKLTEDITTRDKSEILELIRGHITFLSIIAFNKSRMADKLERGGYAEKIGSYFIHSYIFLDVLSGGNGFAVRAQPILAQRMENCTSLKYFRVFVTEMHTLMMYAKQRGYSARVIRRHEAENLVGARHFVARVMIYGRERELWSSRRDGIVRLLRVYGLSPYLWLQVFPLMFFPRLLRPLVFLIRRLLGRPYIAPKEERDRIRGAQPEQV